MLSIMIPTGLNNIGNTCYMNAVVQLLMSCSDATQLFEKKYSSNVLQKFGMFVSRYQSSDVSIDPTEIKEIISNHSLFEGFNQHDAHECLIYLIDILDSELKKCGLPELGATFFNHKYYTHIENLEFPEKRSLFFPELILSLPVSDTLIQSYNQFCEPETLDGWESEIAKRRVLAQKHNVVYYWPKYLFVMFTKYDNNIQKNFANIDIPFFWRINNHYKNSVETVVYMFLGAIVHIGNTWGGHYVSVVYRSNKFFLCDDEDIKEITKDQATRLIRNAYLVLFEK